MIRHLTLIDGRYAIFIEDAILELLDIDEGTPLEVKTDGVRLLLKPLPQASEEQPRGDLNSMIPQPSVPQNLPRTSSPSPAKKSTDRPAEERSLEEELFGDEDESAEDSLSSPQSEDEMSFAEVLASEEESEEDVGDKKASQEPEQEAQLPSDLDGDLMGALEDAFDDPVDSEHEEAAPPSKAALKGTAKAQKNKIHDDNSYEELSDDDLQDLPPLSDEGDALASVDLEEDLFGDDDEQPDDDDDLFGDDDSGASLEDEDSKADQFLEDSSEEASSEEASSEDESSAEDASVEAEAAPPAQESAPPHVAEELPSRTEAEPEAAAAEKTSRGTSEVVVFLNGKEVLRTPLRGPRMVIGRESKADIHLDQRALSRRHACIEKRGAAIWVQDLGSANKTYVNDELIEEPVRMHAGDRIQVGHYEIVLEGLEQASSSTPVVCLEGPEGSHRFAMVGDQITIGRAQSCDISIAHKSISRRHLTISVDEKGGFFVEDLGSQNGVIVRGLTIDVPTALEPGEEFQICEFTLSVGFLEDEEIEANRKESTMLIDPRSMARAAYVDGDFENVKSSQGESPGAPAAGTAKGRARKKRK